jgi:hypothetical protein
MLADHIANVGCSQEYVYRPCYFYIFLDLPLEAKGFCNIDGMKFPSLRVKHVSPQFI